MNGSKRILHEPSYVLHRHDWSESSLVLEVFTRHHGRIALIAKGAKRPSSNFRSVLLPMQPLRLSWSGSEEIRTLKSAEWGGGHVMPHGERLLSGYYLNELVMRLMAREDPHPDAFDAYVQAMHALHDDGAKEAVAGLRAFELLVLQALGHLPDLHAQPNGQPLAPEGAYRLTAEAGLQPEWEPEQAALTGAQWQSVQSALDDNAPFQALQRQWPALPAPARAALRTQLKALLHYHCGMQNLRTRHITHSLQQL